MADHHDETPRAEADPILSSLLADYPDMLEVVEEFVRTLPERLEAMQESLRAGSYGQLARLAHQLRGAGGSHGYAPLTETATYLETAAHGRAVQDMERKLGELNELIQRVQAGLEKDD